LLPPRASIPEWACRRPRQRANGHWPPLSPFGDASIRPILLLLVGQPLPVVGRNSVRTGLCRRRWPDRDRRARRIGNSADLDSRPVAVTAGRIAAAAASVRALAAAIASLSNCARAAGPGSTISTPRCASTSASPEARQVDVKTHDGRNAARTRSIATWLVAAGAQRKRSSRDQSMAKREARGHARPRWRRGTVSSNAAPVRCSTRSGCRRVDRVRKYSSSDAS
jgi:hypothetical protein